MRISLLAVASLAAIGPAFGEVYLKEQFNDEGWKDRWTQSTKWKPAAEMGEWTHTAGEFYADASDKGIQTGPDARFFGISAPLDKTFDSKSGKPLVVQYSVKHEQNIDCGGAYIKMLGEGSKFDAAKFGGETPYKVMFGPDICGTSSKRTHVILHYEPKDDNLMIKNDVHCESDRLTHLYTLVINPNNTFEVQVDGKTVREGNLEDEFDFLPPKEIKDPDVTKPEDWVDDKMMPDPTDVKPEGYDDIPPEIPDPESTKPEDWDDEDDGEWEAPMIDNPDYKGPWSPKMIDNPEYKGPWKHPKIPNPDYKPDDKLYMVCDGGCTHVGFELWQVKTGTIFDDIIVTDSLEEAQKFAEETFFAKKDGEKEMYDKIEEEKREAMMQQEDEEDDSDDEDDLHDEF